MQRRTFLALCAGALAALPFGRSANAMTRPIVLLQPKRTEVAFQQPNPTFTVADLEIVSGALNPGDSLDNYDTALRFTTSRNYPYSNASEYVGQTYKISATGMASAIYDFRYKIGQLVVVAA